MKRALLLFLSIITFQSFAAAQTVNSPCPKFWVSANINFSQTADNIGYKITFEKDYDTSKLSYLWTVHKGKIVSGQGTPTIAVKPDEGLNGGLTATVKLQGLPESCSNTASETVSIDAPPVVREILSCPQFSVSANINLPQPGDNIGYKVTFKNNYNSSKLSYVWTVYNGKILNGQGTPAITIKPEDLYNKSIVATVKVHGLPENCRDTASEAVIVDPAPVAQKIGEYGKVSSEKENSELDSFAAALKIQWTASGFIMKSFTRNTDQLSAYKNLQQILRQLESRGIDRERIRFSLEYEKEEKTEIFIVPAGASDPESKGEILNATKLTEKLKSAKPETNNKTKRSLNK